MAKANNPPFGQKQRDLEVHEWSRPVSDFPDLSQAGVHKKNSRAGKASARSKAPKVKAKHAEVLRLMKQIEGKNAALSQDDLANKIRSRLPTGMQLKESQIIKIMRNSKKQ
jgi:hypothetical protein